MFARDRFAAGDQWGAFWTAVSCGAKHTVAISRRGDLLASGSNQFGQLTPLARGKVERLESGGVPGCMFVSGEQLQRALLGEGVQLTSVECGWSHTVALDSAGRVWVWGRNHFGQAGQGHCKPVDGAVQVGFPDRIARVSSGSEHLLAVGTSQAERVGGGRM
jgi:alpha-tubulin suppressor-like RCC1 family protein